MSRNFEIMFIKTGRLSQKLKNPCPNIAMTQKVQPGLPYYSIVDLKMVLTVGREKSDVCVHEGVNCEIHVDTRICYISYVELTCKDVIAHLHKIINFTARIAAEMAIKDRKISTKMLFHVRRVF